MNPKLSSKNHFHLSQEKKTRQQVTRIRPYGGFIILEYYYGVHPYPQLLFPEGDGDTVAFRLRNDPVIGDDPNFWTLVRDSVVIKWDVHRATWTDPR